MKIVIDLQSLQTESRNRGMGQYSLALARAMIVQGNSHEFLVILNHGFPETVDMVRKEFRNLIPPENMVLFKIPTPIAENDPNNRWRHQVAELVREHFLQQLRPDWVHISSLLFEGLENDAVTSLGRFTNLPTAVTLYDLIPYIYPEQYLSNPLVKSWYMEKLEYLRKATLLLAISEHTRQDAIRRLELPADQVINISADVDAQFRIIKLDTKTINEVRQRYGLTRDFVMYTGGINYRKNIEALIEAYALLPAEVRIAHHLVIVCGVQDEDRQRLFLLASRLGLAKDEMVVTGFVSGKDLVALYNLCKLFVFPSLYEGFGLPVLEAMRCRAPVIGSNNSSIPEIIQLGDALFDPTSINSISEKIRQALTDEQFRQKLQENGILQSTRFSWEISAGRALEAMQLLYERKQHEDKKKVILPIGSSKPRLAYFSPLPPEKSGIADYSAELLPELAKYYRIDLITDLRKITASDIANDFPRRSIREFQRHAYDYDRILYQFGNSPFHSHMFNLLKKYPGTAVLHDFFLSNILHHLNINAPRSKTFNETLYRSHGYPALQDWFAKGAEYTVGKYPSCLDVLQGSQGVIVHSNFALHLAKQFFPFGGQQHIINIPQVYRLPNKSDRLASRKGLGLPEQAFIVCSFGIINSLKLHDLLLKAWLSSNLAHNPQCYLIFVGSGGGNAQEQYLRQCITDAGMEKQISITGYVSSEKYKQYLQAADVAVQLRKLSRGETSRAVLDCLGHGVTTIVNAHGSLAELPEDCTVKIPEDFSDADLSGALEQLFCDPVRRQTLGQAAMDYVRTHSDPARIALKYTEAIEAFHLNHPVSLRKRLLSSIVALPVKSLPVAMELTGIANAISENMPRLGLKQLLVDISELIQRDAGSGIQRVVRNILHQFIENTPAGYRVEAVYRSEKCYRYARNFMTRFLGVGDLGIDDAPVDITAGDIFLGLDLDAQIDEAAQSWLKYHARRGLKVYFVIYDLLPLLRPDCFSPGMHALFMKWIESISSLADGLVCISQSVAIELGKWLDQHPIMQTNRLHIGFFHLGANIMNNSHHDGMSKDEATILAQIKGHLSLLMVGTIEPRKGYAQVLDAVKELNATGQDILLVIVGKKGWVQEELLKQLRTYAKDSNHLIWLDNSSDELLLKLYQSTSALLMASEGEGFGLPLVEAGRYGLPIIARDLPVFREITGDHAFYFNGTDSNTLANAIKEWAKLYRLGKHPRSENMRWLTWKESANQLKKVIFESNWIASWDTEHGLAEMMRKTGNKSD